MATFSNTAKPVYVYDQDSDTWFLVGTPGPAGPQGPAGTFTVASTAPSSPSSGDTWFDQDTGKWYMHYADGDSNQWVQIAGPSAPVTNASAASGGGSNKVFYENETSVTDNYEITTGFNAITAGPIAVDSGVTVTIPSGSTWVVV